jgi:hypothetical protein
MARNIRSPINDPIQKSIIEPDFYNNVVSKLKNRENEYPSGLISNQEFFKTLEPYGILENFITFRKNLHTIAEYLGYNNFKIMSGLSVKEIKNNNDNSEILLHNIVDYDNISIIDDSEI